MRTLLIGLTAATVAFAAPAAAQSAELNYPKGSLGYNALVRADYATAEAQLRADLGVNESDPARLINLGQVYAMTGRVIEARRMFRLALQVEDVELVLSNDRVMGSHDAARAALRGLKPTLASR